MKDRNVLLLLTRWAFFVCFCRYFYLSTDIILALRIAKVDADYSLA